MQSGRRLVIMGQGYVGLPLAMRAVEVGYDVIGYDIDTDRLQQLMTGESYIGDVATPTLGAALATGRYLPTGDPARCGDFDIAVITVPTPLRDGSPDLTFVEAAARTLASYLRPGATVVLESTTYPGTTEEVLLPLLESGSGLVGGKDFHLGFSPERIDPGNRTWTLKTTPKVVSGIDPASLKAVRAFFDTIVDETIAASGTREAELAKLLENTFRHVNIALVNELAMYAFELGIDIWDVIDAASSKPFGFMRFTPGPGVGGHCLPIDPSYLSWQVQRSLGRSFRFVELANDINEHMPEYVVRRLMEGMNRRRQALNGSRILVLGIAYKRNTGDAREAPAKAVIDRLLALGADVRVADPHVPDQGWAATIMRVFLSDAEVRDADAVLLLTDHDVFDYELILANAHYVLDTRRRMYGDVVEHL